MTNTLFYGDNLDIMREYIASKSVDLIYLDPPFNSSRSYNVLFKDESGGDSEAQIMMQMWYARSAVRFVLDRCVMMFGKSEQSITNLTM